MDTIAFWTLIEETRQLSNGVMDDQLRLLVDRLVEYDLEAIIEFDCIFTELRRVSYRADLWDAAHIIGCGCSESCFVEFQGWLIAQGKSVFESAMENPETLLELIGNSEDEREAIIDGRAMGVASEAYERKTDQEMVLCDYIEKVVLIGKHTMNKDLEHKYPKLFAKFGDWSCFDLE
jgi:hypothetical protein